MSEYNKEKSLKFLESSLTRLGTSLQNAQGIYESQMMGPEYELHEMLRLQMDMSRVLGCLSEIMLYNEVKNPLFKLK